MWTSMGMGLAEMHGFWAVRHVPRYRALVRGREASTCCDVSAVSIIGSEKALTAWND